MKNSIKKGLVYSGVAALMLMAACQQTTAPAASGRMKVAFSARPAPASAGSAGITSFIAMGADTLLSTGDTLVIDSAQIVLRKIELKRVDGSACDTLMTDEDREDGCEEVEAGPVLVNLPLGDTAAQMFSVSIPIGSYDEVEFQVHVPTGDSRDQVFLAANPQFTGTSIRVVGTFNGKAFVFTSSLTAEQELELSPPLMVSDTGATSLTIRADVGKWFLNGTALVDPATALVGGANEELVRDNIRASFKGLHDRDCDGLDDGGEEGHGGGDGGH